MIDDDDDGLDEAHNEKPPEIVYAQWKDDNGEFVPFTLSGKRIYEYDIEYRAVSEEEHEAKEVAEKEKDPQLKLGE